MRKSIISAIFLVFVLMVLGYFIYDAKVKNKNFNTLDTSINKIMMLDKEFDLYIRNGLTYDNFNIINEKMLSFERELELIEKNSFLSGVDNISLKKKLEDLKLSMKNEFYAIDSVKSYRAILNNSFRIIQKLYNENKELSRFNRLYSLVMVSDKNIEIDKKAELEKIRKLIEKEEDRSSIFFLKHAKIIIMYEIKLEHIKDELIHLNLKGKLKSFYSFYEQYAQKSLEKAQWSIGILFLLLVFMIILYLFYEYKLILSNDELSKFRKTVENSDNIVLITDIDENIKYVNTAFTKVTGYTSDEVLGKKPSILKSGKQSEGFYKELKETIYSGKSWSGEFINVNKNGNLSYEKASITPVIDDEGNIKEFISIKLDVTSERITSQKLKEKESLLVQQSKMAAMGEMLENIAHQWRQPLSIISISSSGIVAKKKLGLEIKDEEVIKVLEKINDTTQYLSETIDNFRDFFKPNKPKIVCNLKELYQKTISLINSRLVSYEIEVIEDIDDTLEIKTLDIELMQVIMNLLNNAKDILETKPKNDRMVFVRIYKEKSCAIISIKDNAGGISEEIINRVFEPYFTTKHQSNGTGIGLYMSQEIISKHMNGNLSVRNDKFIYKNKEYQGAEFIISLPLYQENN